MPSRFDWESDEEPLWQEQRNVGKRRFWPSRRFLLVTVLLLTFIAGGGLVLLRQIEREAEEVSAAVAEEILSSQRVWQRAIADEDEELFASVLSGSQPDWMDAQYALFENDLLMGRWTLGLEPIGEPEITSIDVSPDLTEAEVKLQQPYATAVDQLEANSTSLPDGDLDQIILEQALIFRRGQDKWLHSAPQRPFWGARKSVHSRYLTISYPERDEELAERLVRDLDEDMATLCAMLSYINCAPDLHLYVRLDNDPDSMLDTADPASMIIPATAQALRLPTPTLIGKPVNETSYQALRQGYAVPVLTAAITSSVDYWCCESGLLYQALVDKQLSELGLCSWPLDKPENRAAFFRSVVGSLDMRQLWQREAVSRPMDPANLPVYALVDYVTGGPSELSITTLQRALGTSPAAQENLQQIVLASGRSVDDIARDWLHYLAGLYGQQSAPLPLPEQDIQLLCEQEGGTSATLVRYDPSEDRWTAELNDRSFIYMNPLPDGNAVLLQEGLEQTEESRIILWQDGRETDVFGRPVTGGLFRTSPGGQDLILFSFESETYWEWTFFQLLIPDLCESTGCIIRSLYSPPIWSPDGKKTIVSTGRQTLWLADASGRNQTYFGAGIAPFWRDDNRVGYLNTGGREADEETSIVITNINDAQSEILIPATKWRSVIPDELADRVIEVRAIKISPAHPDLLLGAAAILDEEQWSDDGGLLISYDLQENELKLLLSLPYNLHPHDEFSFSPDGEWVTVHSTNHSGMMSQLHLYNLANDRIIVLDSTPMAGDPGYDWSADSQWLLRAEAGYLHLFAPNYGYQRLVVHEYPRCNFAAWINR